MVNHLEIPPPPLTDSFVQLQRLSKELNGRKALGREFVEALAAMSCTRLIPSFSWMSLPSRNLLVSLITPTAYYFFSIREFYHLFDC